MICAYILKCADNTYYIGSTSDFERRLAEHRKGKNRSTRFKLPVKVVFKKKFLTLKEARKFEFFIKRQRNHNFYQKLIKGVFV